MKTNERRYYYRRPTELREGNVFSHVCHSVQGGGPSKMRKVFIIE